MSATAQCQGRASGLSAIAAAGIRQLVDAGDGGLRPATGVSRCGAGSRNPPDAKTMADGWQRLAERLEGYARAMAAKNV